MTQLFKITPLKKIRSHRGLTLKQLSDSVNIDVGNLSRIERGVQRSVDGAKVISDYFDNQIHPEQILYPKDFPDYCPPQEAA